MDEDLLMLAGDVHGYFNHVITLLDRARNKGVPRIFQLGDFGAWEHTADGVEYFDDVSRYAEQRGVTVYFLGGNHDNERLVMEMYGDVRDEEGFVRVRKNLYMAPRGHVWEWGGTRFIALGGAYSVDKEWRLQLERVDQFKAERRAARVGEVPADKSGTLWFPEEEMTDAQFMEIMDRVTENWGTVDVVLSHDKPRGSNPPWSRKDLPECLPNQNRLQHALVELRAKRLYHGHLHFPYTDRIPTRDGQYAWVFGLDCDPRAAEHHNYRVEDSYTIVRLPFDD